MSSFLNYQIFISLSTSPRHQCNKYRQYQLPRAAGLDGMSSTMCGSEKGKRFTNNLNSSRNLYFHHKLDISHICCAQTTQMYGERDAGRASKMALWNGQGQDVTVVCTLQQLAGGDAGGIILNGF